MRRLALLGLLLGTASAAPPATLEAEARFREALLVEAADGDIDAAIRIYADLARTLEGSEHAFLRARVLEALGDAHFSIGQYADANRAYDGCRRIATSGLAVVDTTRCVNGARNVALRQGAVRQVPTSWTFDDGVHGFVLQSDYGSMAVEPVDGDNALVWNQEVDETRDGRLWLEIETPERPPRGLRFQVRTDGDWAVLAVFAIDTTGRIYQLRDDYFLADADMATVETTFASMKPRDPTGPGLDPAQLAFVFIRDATGDLKQRARRHQIILDDFEIF